MDGEKGAVEDMPFVGSRNKQTTEKQAEGSKTRSYEERVIVENSIIHQVQISLGATGIEKDDVFKSMEQLCIKSAGSGTSANNVRRKPVVIIVVGMAGSGKTSLLHRLVCHTQASNIQSYVMNLDPATMTLPFGSNIYIRDTVKYDEVMKQFNLGPNGGILQSLNLFSTRFDEVISTIENRADQLDYVLVDTPGQIETFAWSASGAIITEAFASTFPTVIAYVVDTPRSAHPPIFMSNMLCACSILYKTQLPLVLAFNKIDVAEHQFAVEWMEDFKASPVVLASDDAYTSTLTDSLSFALDDFYKNLKYAGVSAVSGAGMEAFFKAIDDSAEELIELYEADLDDERQADEQRMEEDHRQENMENLRKDMEKSGGETVILSNGLKDREAEADKDMMEEDEVMDDLDFDNFEEDEDDDDFVEEDGVEEVDKFSF